MAETADERWEAAEAAAREAVRLRPAKVEPKALLARVLLRRSEELADAEAQEALIDEAIDLSRAASAIDLEDPEPLVLFYRAKLAREGRGDEESINALYDAALIAPQDLGTRLNAATALLNVGLVAEARDLLDPISFDPHNREAAATARQLIDMSENRSAGGRVVIEMAPASD